MLAPAVAVVAAAAAATYPSLAATISSSLQMIAFFPYFRHPQKDGKEFFSPCPAFIPFSLMLSSDRVSPPKYMMYISSNQLTRFNNQYITMLES